MIYARQQERGGRAGVNTEAKQLPGEARGREGSEASAPPRLPAIFYAVLAAAVAASLAAVSLGLRLRAVQAQVRAQQVEAAAQRQELDRLRGVSDKIAEVEARSRTLKQERAQLEEQLPTLQTRAADLRKENEALLDRIKRAAEGKPDPVIALDDGAGAVVVGRGGALARYARAEPLPEFAAKAVAAQDAGVPALEQLAGTAARAKAGTSIQVSSPVRTVVRTQQPEFAWTRVAGATRYSLVVVDGSVPGTPQEQTAPAGRGDNLRVRWMQKPLQRGHTYEWNVLAFRGTDKMDAAPDSLPRFQVLGETETQALETQLGQPGASPLVRGLLLARAGVVDEAEQELRRVAEANPDSSVARELLASIRRRQGAPEASTLPETPKAKAGGTAKAEGGRRRVPAREHPGVRSRR
jgi:hypothetical protein